MTQNRATPESKEYYYHVLTPALIEQTARQLAFMVIGLKEYDEENETNLLEQLTQKNNHFKQIIDGCLIEYEIARNAAKEIDALEYWIENSSILLGENK